MRFSNLLTLFSLSGPQSPLSNNGNTYNHISSFIQEIETFESTKFTASPANNDSLYWLKTPTEPPISLSQYEFQYVLRLSDWNDQPNFLLTAMEYAKALNTSIWATSLSNNFIDIQLSKDQGVQLLSLLSEYSFKSKISIIDLPQTIFETYPQSSLVDDSHSDFGTNTELFFKTYRDLDSIYSWYELLVATYPEILKLEYIGNTFEGRPMIALRLSTHSNLDPSESIKTVVITGGIHSREWISVSTSCYILYSLLKDYDNGSPLVREYLNNLDFLFLPLMNPDGYAFTWKSERLWRKNKQQTYNPRCRGIDIDHSFDFHFTSDLESPCSDDYSGNAPFEALESLNWDRYLNETKHSHPIYAYIDLHSYAQEVLYPYAYSCDILPRDEENLLELAYGLSQAIRLKSGKYYNVLKACQDKGADFLPNMGAGSALDYMYHNKAYWAFILKLRDSGTHGFLLPPKYIVPTGEEIYSSIKYFASFLLKDDGNWLFN